MLLVGIIFLVASSSALRLGTRDVEESMIALGGHRIVLPTVPPKVERFTLHNANDVSKLLKSEPNQRDELLPILENILHNGNLTKENKMELNNMLVTFSHDIKSSAKDENDKSLTNDELKTALHKLGVQDGDGNFNVTKTREGNVVIVVEEIETDDPTAKDQIVLDYRNSVDKSIIVDGEEQDTENAD